MLIVHHAIKHAWKWNYVHKLKTGKFVTAFLSLIFIHFIRHVKRAVSSTLLLPPLFCLLRCVLEMIERLALVCHNSQLNVIDCEQENVFQLLQNLIHCFAKFVQVFITIELKNYSFFCVKMNFSRLHSFAFVYQISCASSLFLIISPSTLISFPVFRTFFVH